MEGQGRGEVVITKYPSRAQYPGASFSRGLISVVECISADGSVLPPCIILPGKGHLEGRFPSKYALLVGWLDSNYLLQT
ncbi:uncharacterized protein EURHEDRAFT_478486 [Aspergillus ruber CBS 135680]|uniref:Uncharacterized protein n=1 Tax=Aspergillus ruber (strain CBS 135680) TaxID=1388766 RepID=A0A017SFJ6_ASPRC|nr:uncharacterized protein EURHEDRAFT_478486 [Aspergillus ruber CBS 135680]EYE95414.1 hypothetical protein EURHEDRAFT_478486 [Aspergillus ruber CBS 135680]